MRKHKAPEEVVTRIKLNRNHKKLKTHKNTRLIFKHPSNIHRKVKRTEKEFDYKNSNKRKTLNKLYKRFDKSGYEPDEDGIDHGTKRM